ETVLLQENVRQLREHAEIRRIEVRRLLQVVRGRGQVAQLFVGESVVVIDLRGLIAHLQQMLRVLQRDVGPIDLQILGGQLGHRKLIGGIGLQFRRQPWNRDTRRLRTGRRQRGRRRRGARCPGLFSAEESGLRVRRRGGNAEDATKYYQYEECES